MRRFAFRNLPLALAIAVGVAGVSLSLAPSIAQAQTTGKPVTTASGLQIIDTVVGTGPSPKPGQICVMHYTGWLYENGQKGKKFDSSVDRNEPFEFPIGQHRVIAGWDSGFEGMRVGGRRRLFIPYQLAYGEAGRPPAIPPKSELIFDVELMAVADTLPRSEPAPRGQPAPPPQCPTWAAVSGRS